jgi:hypothetical protein
VCFGPAQIHAQYHLRPVLSLGASRAGLNVEISVVAVHFAGKHATKLERSQFRLERRDIAFNLTDRIGIILVDSKGQQLVRIAKPTGKLVQNDNDLFQLRTFLAERLGSLGFIPDVGLLEFALNFGQAFRLAVIVKDTPSTQQCVQRDRLWFV